MTHSDPLGQAGEQGWPAAAFLAYGTPIGLRSNDAALLVQACAVLPFGWQPTPGAAVDHWYTVAVEDGTITLSFAEMVLAVADASPPILTALARHAELTGATLAADVLFVHAGVVGLHGRALLLPGRSFSGKTTLVKALLEAGAIYYSDDYAVLDRLGQVHPYPRPLAIRAQAGQPAQQRSAESLGGTTGTMPLPIGLIVVTTYQPGARWRPRPLTPGQALLALMDNTVAAQGDPRHSMPILKQAVTHARTFSGPRGAASAVIRDCFAWLDPPLAEG